MHIPIVIMSLRQHASSSPFAYPERLTWRTEDPVSPPVRTPRRRLSRRGVAGTWGVCAVLVGLCLRAARGFNLDVGSARVLEGPPGSYFGFSLTIHTNTLGHWLLVGAPRASDIYQPLVNTSGALYQCDLLQETPCEQVMIDTRGNRVVNGEFIPRGKFKVRLRYTDQKDDQWLGVTVHAHQHGDGAVVTCAHRWADLRYARYHYMMMNGACYIMSGDMDYNRTRRLLPLTHGEQVTVKPREYLYAYGQVGIAAHYTQDGEKLLLGAPGLRDWTGGVVEYAGTTDYPAQPDRQDVHKNSYLGYSVTSGKFYGGDTTYYVSGGPKINLKGRVVVYLGRFDMKATLDGAQLGEYFGAALCVADVNHDGLDDLLVGAPLYKGRLYEEGRVAVYIMRHTHVFDHVFDLLGSELPGSRFGSAIASADLTLDGYPDVLVGAPYEDAGHGAIYIYNGHHHGLHSVMSQRVSAFDLHTDLRGFGYAVAMSNTRPEQDYPDVAIGAYSSSMAVLLPVRPLVVIELNSSTYPAMIDPHVVRCHLTNLTHSPRSCLAVGVTFRYSGIGLAKTAAFTVTVRADITRQDEDHRLPIRGGFKNGTVNNTSITTQALPSYSAAVKALPPHQHWADHFIFVLNKHVVDVITPVSISVEVKLVTSQENGTGKLQPMVDKYCKRSMTLVVPFDKLCGEDNECKTNIQLHAFVRWASPDVHYVILGQQEPISIEFHVSNAGEKAYMTSLTLLHPPDLQFTGTRRTSDHPAKSGAVTCTPHASPEDVDAHNGSAALVCDVGNPINAFVVRSWTVLFVRPVVYHGESYLRDTIVVNVTTRTRSQEKYLDDNDVILVLPVKVSADMDLSGVSYPEQHLYEATPSNSTTTEYQNDTSLTPETSQPEVYHIYALRNDGPGLFPGGHVEVMVPVKSVTGSRLLDYHVEIRDDAAVHEEKSESGPIALRERREVDEVNTTSGDPTSADPLTLLTPVALLGRSSLAPFDVTCETMQCDVTHLTVGPINAGDSITIRIYMHLYVGNLTVLQHAGAVRMLTRVVVQSIMPSPPITVVDLQVATLVTPRQAVMGDGGVPWWVVVTSVGIGLILLLVVIAVLYKYGFFTRAEREELVKLISQNEDNEEQESRMLHHASDNRGEGGDWQSYDPWQPQSPETSLLIWHANGSISHNSREEYLASTRGSSSSGTYDRNRNEKGGRNRHAEQNGTVTLTPTHVNLPSTSGSGGSGDHRVIRPHSMLSADDEVFFDVNARKSSVDIPNYLVIYPAEDSDEEDVFNAELPPAPPTITNRGR